MGECVGGCVGQWVNGWGQVKSLKINLDLVHFSNKMGFTRNTVVPVTCSIHHYANDVILA